MSTDTHDCGICSLRQITKTSNHWCPECEEAICDECKEHHKVLKATRNHEPIPISNYKSLPSFITDLQQACIYHNEKYQLYCTEHNLPMCIKCIKDHQKCTVSPFEEIINDAKSSEQFQDLETRLEDLLQNIDKIKKDRKANVISIEDMKKRHIADIHQIRVEINNHLDNLERQMIKDLEEKESQCKERIVQVLSLIKEKETTINQCHANFLSIKQYASNLQTFFGMREIDVKVIETEQYLQSSLTEAKMFDRLDLVVTIDKGMQNIVNGLKHFALTEIIAWPADIEFSRAKDKQAQFLIAPLRKNVSDVKLFLQKTISINGNSIRGCSMLEGNFLITNHCAKKPFIFLSADGSLKYNMSLDPCKGYDVTLVDEKTVAITSGHSSKKKGIYIINMTNQSRQQFVELPDAPYGITRDHDSLFVCVQRRGIYKVNTVDYSSHHLINCKLPILSYVSVFNDKIYYTDDKDNSVVCCDSKGSRHWTFKNDSVLRLPRGLTVDNDNNVFVAGEGSSNVVIISYDGKQHKEILTKEDGIRDPSSIFLDKQKRELLVANLEQIAFLYRVT